MGLIFLRICEPSVRLFFNRIGLHQIKQNLVFVIDDRSVAFTRHFVRAVSRSERYFAMALLAPRLEAQKRKAPAAFRVGKTIGMNGHKRARAINMGDFHRSHYRSGIRYPLSG